MCSCQVACGRGALCCRCTWKQMRNLRPPMGPGSSGATRLTDRLATFQVHAHTLASALLPSSHLLLRFSLLTAISSFTKTCSISLRVNLSPQSTSTLIQPLGRPRRSPKASALFIGGPNPISISIWLYSRGMFPLRLMI